MYGALVYCLEMSFANPFGKALLSRNSPTRFPQRFGAVPNTPYLAPIFFPLMQIHFPKAFYYLTPETPSLSRELTLFLLSHLI